MADVFISYSSKDRARVKPLHDFFVQRGLSVFWDLETPLGQNWDDWIRANLRAATCCVVVWSKNSVISRNVQHEVRIADEAGKLIPANLDALRAEDYPMGFFTIQSAQLQDWQGGLDHEGAVRLIDTVCARVKSKGSTSFDPQKDLEALFLLASQNDAVAQAELGYRYIEGVGGVPKDYLQAIWYTLAAARQGNARAQNNMGALFSGRHTNELKEVSVEQFKKSAEQGFAVGLRNAALELERTGPAGRRQAAVYFESAAKQGDLFSLARLGSMFLKGENVKQNVRRGLECLNAAADAGYAYAFVQLGFHYFSSSKPSDAKKALENFDLAIEKGDTDIASYVGLHYLFGTKIPIDKARALHYYGIAAEGGDQSSQHQVAKLLLDGIVTPTVKKPAMFWLQKAYAGGNVDAGADLAELLLSDNPNSKQKAKAEKILRAIKNKSERAAKMFKQNFV